MLTITKSGTFSDTIKLYQLIKEIFANDSGLILNGLDVSTIDSTTIRVSKGKALSQTLDIVSLHDHTSYNIYNIYSGQRETNLPDGTHLLLLALYNNKPEMVLLLERATGKFDTFPPDYIFLKSVTTSGGAIVSIDDEYLDFKTRKLTVSSDQEESAISGSIEHNTLGSIQGGNPPNEFYHLSQGEYTALQNNIIPNILKTILNASDSNPDYLQGKFDSVIFGLDISGDHLTIKDDSLTKEKLSADIDMSDKGLTSEFLGSDKYSPIQSETVSVSPTSRYFLWDALQILKRLNYFVKNTWDNSTISTINLNERVLVSTSPSGIFTGHENEIAIKIGNDQTDDHNWIFQTPYIGQIIYHEDQKRWLYWAGSNWEVYVGRPGFPNGTVVFVDNTGSLTSDNDLVYDSALQQLRAQNIRGQFVSMLGNNGVTITIHVQDYDELTTHWELVFENGILVKAAKYPN